MRVTRGDIVVVDFPQAPGQPSKRRPAVVVQADYNNARLTNAIFAMITSNTALAATEHAPVLIDVLQSHSQGTGLSRTSAIKCENLFTLPQTAVSKVIGRLSPVLIRKLDSALKASLGLT